MAPRSYSKPSLNKGKNIALRHLYGIPAMSCVSGTPSSCLPSSALQTKQREQIWQGFISHSPRLSQISRCRFCPPPPLGRDTWLYTFKAKTPPGGCVPFCVSAAPGAASACHYQTLIASILQQVQVGCAELWNTEKRLEEVVQPKVFRHVITPVRACAALFIASCILSLSSFLS